MVLHDTFPEALKTRIVNTAEHWVSLLIFTTITAYMSP